MGGFKEGTVDGWEDEEDDDEAPETEPAAEELGGREEKSDAAPDEADGGAPVHNLTTGDIPWILRRNSITDGREQTVQLHLQEETMNVQRTQKSAIEGRLGESVRKADLREAALLVGLQQTDDVIEVLEAWGYALD